VDHRHLDQQRLVRRHLEVGFRDEHPGEQGVGDQDLELTPQRFRQTRRQGSWNCATLVRASRTGRTGMTLFRLLGELQAGDQIEFGPAKQRLVLAALLLDAGQPVPLDTVIDRVWGAGPPKRARDSVYSYLARLRAVLQTLPGEPVRIERRGGGYRLNVAPADVDLHRMRQLATAARASADDMRRADLLDQALQLWGGTPLPGLGGAWADEVRAALEQEHLDAAVLWARAWLASGHAEEVITRIRPLADREPLFEPLSEILILAQCAAGRAAEALSRYDRLRRRLRDDLGVDPGPELREAYRQALDLTATGSGVGVERPPRSLPAQLPMDVRGFTGRYGELDWLGRMLLPHSDPEETGVRIGTIAGAPGAGKTALAVHWAHRVAEHFPDGQLYVDLRGYGPDSPVEVGDALVGFLRALGLGGEDIPLGVAERAARYRTEVAGKRLLIVLDNACSPDQIRPLLPGAASCAVLVTSRDSLAGLVVVDGAQRLDLDPLPLPDALALLRGLLGPRVDRDPAAATRLALLCARLPLALRIGAELLASQPQAPLGALVAELDGRPAARPEGLLALFDGGGDGRSAVRTVFSWSYQSLVAPVARAFRLLGLHPGPDWELEAAAALLGVTLGEVRASVNALVRANLVRVVALGRFAMHDLLRDYAVALATEAPVEERESAVARLEDHCVHSVVAAMARLHPAEAGPPPLTPHDPAVSRAGRATGEPQSWLQAERANLVVVCAAAGRAGHHQVAVDLATALFRHLDAGGHSPDALRVHLTARDAARRLGRVGEEARALKNLAGVYWRVGDYVRARQYVEEAIELARSTGDETLEAVSLTNLSTVAYARAEYRLAASYNEAALQIFRRLGDRAREGNALSELGMHVARLGRYREAAGLLRRGLELVELTGHWHFAVCARDNYAFLLLQQGRLLEAAEQLECALATAVEQGTSPDEALILARLGTARARLGDVGSMETLDRALSISRSTGGRSIQAEALMARACLHRASGRLVPALADAELALALVQDVGELDLAPTAHNELGRVLAGLRRDEQAVDQHQEARTLATRSGNRYELGLAALGLASAYERGGRAVEARPERAEAEAIFIELDVPIPVHAQ
jgi:DNA-binding SARP family transcriptional activator/tetratricopeptide (TPR) repeat protein